jgi:hypothetical protein
MKRRHSDPLDPEVPSTLAIFLWIASVWLAGVIIITLLVRALT